MRPIDPLFVDTFDFSEVSGKFRINLQMMNVTMDGFKDYVVTGVRYDLRVTLWYSAALLTPCKNKNLTRQLTGQYQRVLYNKLSA